jgi:hypothetical protein
VAEGTLRGATVAAIEEDLAYVADALDAVADLEALMLALCRTSLSVPQADRMSRDLVRVRTGLEANRKWLSWLRNGKHLREPVTGDIV